VLRRLNDFMATIPDELTILSGFRCQRARQFSFSYRSTVVRAQQVSRYRPTNLWYCASRSGAIHDVSRIYSSVGCECTEGRHYYAKTQSIKGFQPEIIDTLIEQGLPFSSLFVHRAPSLSWSRVGASETAFTAAGSSNG